MIVRLLAKAGLSRTTVAPGTMSPFISITVPLVLADCGSGAEICSENAGEAVETQSANVMRNRLTFIYSYPNQHRLPGRISEAPNHCFQLGFHNCAFEAIAIRCKDAFRLAVT